MGGRKGAGGFITAAIILFVILGALLAFAKANNITDASGAINWVRAKSAQVDSCFGATKNGWPTWECLSAPPEFTDPGVKTPTDGTTIPGEGDSTTPSVPNVNESGNSSEFQAQLEAIPTKDSEKVAYERSEWNHWLGSRCDSTREQIIREQTSNIVMDSENCKVSSFELDDPYGKGILTKPSQADVDHIIPLAYAARNGGQAWDKAKKEQFANDKSHLVLVSAGENRSKSDKGPSEWMPKTSYECTYSKIFISTVSQYGLSLPSKDKAALEKGLRSCKS